PCAGRPSAAPGRCTGTSFAPDKTPGARTAAPTTEPPTKGECKMTDRDNAGQEKREAETAEAKGKEGSGTVPNVAPDQAKGEAGAGGRRRCHGRRDRRRELRRRRGRVRGRGDRQRRHGNHGPVARPRAAGGQVARAKVVRPVEVRRRRRLEGRVIGVRLLVLG